MDMAENALLSVQNLSVDFDTDQGTVYAVRDVSFDLAPGEILGIVGESGSGKSVSMYAIMGLLAPNGHVKSGRVIFDGKDIGRGQRIPGQRRTLYFCPYASDDRRRERKLCKPRQHYHSRT